MSEPTQTRASLRRALARALRMEFARRYPDVLALTAAASTTSVTDSKLTQPAGFWTNSYIYFVDGAALGDVRRVTGFSAGTLTLEYPTTGLPVAGNTYELHSIWNATDLHQALDQALLHALPHFFDVVTDETLVIEQNKLAYSLSALTSAPWVIAKIWREVASAALRGTATGGAVNSLIDTGLIGQLGSVTSVWKVSLYDGTGKGQVRSVSAVKDGTGTITPSVNWNPAPDTTSRYALWNPTVQYEDWPRVLAARFDQKEWPDTVYFRRMPSEHWGLRLRLQYLSRPAALASEAATTVVPSAFVLEEAQARLYSSLANDSRVDRGRYAQASAEHAQLALQARQAHAFRAPDTTLWQEEDTAVGVPDPADPLGWRMF